MPPTKPKGQRGRRRKRQSTEVVADTTGDATSGVVKKRISPLISEEDKEQIEKYDRLWDEKKPSDAENGALKDYKDDLKKTQRKRRKWEESFTKAQLHALSNGGYFTKTQLEILETKLQDGPAKYTKQPRGRYINTIPYYSMNAYEKKKFEKVLQRKAEYENFKQEYVKLYRKLRKKYPTLEFEGDKVDRSGKTKLHQVVLDGKLTEVDRLLSQCTNVDTQDYAGWSPLHDGNMAEIAELLMAAGADPSAPAHDKSKGICAEGDATGNTPLHEAAFYDNVEVLKAMLHHGADVNKTNAFGETAFQVSKSEQVQTILRTHSIAYELETRKEGDANLLAGTLESTKIYKV
eukprot:m.60056 g.60056  ORF g.60056 m.60056 type:complete len:348 (+) comp11293_c0_seq2:137-1180(+)